MKEFSSFTESNPAAAFAPVAPPLLTAWAKVAAEELMVPVGVAVGNLCLRCRPAGGAGAPGTMYLPRCFSSQLSLSQCSLVMKGQRMVALYLPWARSACRVVHVLQ